MSIGVCNFYSEGDELILEDVSVKVVNELATERVIENETHSDETQIRNE